MSDVVYVQISLELMTEIRDTLNICAQDLEAELDNTYPQTLREQYPSYLRRWTNDMEAVRKAQMLVQAINMQPWAYQNSCNRKS